MEGLHPVTGKQEASIDIEIAAIVAVNFSAQGLEDIWLVEVFGDPTELLVAKGSRILTFRANVIGVLTSSLVGTDHSVVAINRSRQAVPAALSTIAAINERLTLGEGVVHGLAFALTEDAGPPPITTCHGSVVFVLSQAIR